MANAVGDSHAQSPVKRESPGGRDSANPVVSQRELSIRLRELRNELGLTVEDVAQRLMCSATKISRLETGARRAQPRDVRDLCGIYGITDAAQVAEMMELARKAREPGWWTEYDDPDLVPYVGLEQEAVAITSYSMYHVPGLLQTGDYALALIRGIERKMDLALVRQRVEVRLRRQQLLDQETPPRYRALLDEAVLRRQIGGPAVMRAQLDKILRAVADKKATVQVIPFDASAHASADSNFTILDFGDGSRQPPIVYVEGLFLQHYLQRPAEIARYREAVEYLRDAALTPRDTTSLINQIRSMHEV